MSDLAVYLYNRSLELLDGRRIAKDPAEAFRLNADAARHGYSDAVLAMGWFYLNGVGVARDLELARKWYKRSARQGDPRAMFSLGQMAYDARDFAEALRWFERGLEKGHSRSLFWLGKLYWHGRGVAQDKKRASALFAEAARKKVPEAQRAVAWLARSRGGPTTRCS
jgi:TPR repeat protein